MIMGKYFMQGDDLAEPFAVRRAVFVQELGLPESAVFDGADGDCIHALAYDDDKQPVAAGRLRLCDDGTFWIGYVAVLADKRRRKLGDRAVCLDDLVRDARQRTGEGGFVHDLRLESHSRASLRQGESNPCRF